VCELESRKSPALAIVRSQRQAEVADSIGGKGGTRTLDPGIMSSNFNPFKDVNRLSHLVGGSHKMTVLVE
jgi:hypothetical protein